MSSTRRGGGSPPAKATEAAAEIDWREARCGGPLGARVATRYDRNTATFLAAVRSAATVS